MGRTTIGDKTTLAKLHQDRVKSIIDKENSVPSLEETIQKIDDELSYAKENDIIRYKDLIQEKDELTQKISQIKQERTQYLLKNGELLHKYNEYEKQPRKIHKLDILKKSKKEFLEKDKSDKYQCYRSLRSSIDPEYVYFDEDTVNEENYCYVCKKFRVSMSEEAVMACQGCGSQTTITIKHAKPSVNDPPAENKLYEYQRFSHFCSWLENIQGKESGSVPDVVINTVLREVHRERMTERLNELDEDDIKRYLKKHRNKGYDKYYDHCTQILYRVTENLPVQMSPEMEHNLKLMFMAVQEPFELYKNKRHNFSSYAYIIYKFCQLLGYYDFLPKLKLHKNEGKIYEHDQIWRKICKHMGGEEKGWTFIKSYNY